MLMNEGDVVALDPSDQSAELSTTIASVAVTPASRLTSCLETARGEIIQVKLQRLVSQEALFVVDQPVRTTEPLMLSIHDGASCGPKLWESPCTIHWGAERAEGMQYGAFLRDEVPEEILLRPEWDRRLTLRYEIDLPARIWWSGARRNRPARIVNYSVNGIGLIAPDPGVVGRKLIVMTLESAAEAVCVGVTACWQAACEGGFMIGCELSPGQGRRFAGKWRPPIVNPPE